MDSNLSSDQQQNPNKFSIKLISFIILVIIPGLIGYFLGKKQVSVQSINRLTPSVLVSPTIIKESVWETGNNNDVISSTENWKFYENKKIGISFKYPPELIVGEDIMNKTIKIYLGEMPSQVAHQTADGIYAPVEIDFFSNDALVDFINFEADHSITKAKTSFIEGVIGSFKRETLVKENIKVDNKKAIKYSGIYTSYSAMDEERHQTVLIETSEGIYAISRNFYIKSFSNNALLNTLISTFKFLK